MFVDQEEEALDFCLVPRGRQHRDQQLEAVTRQIAVQYKELLGEGLNEMRQGRNAFNHRLKDHLASKKGFNIQMGSWGK